MVEKQRVLSIVHNLGRGGVQRVAQNFCELYSELGYDSRVLVLESGGVRESFLIKKGIQVYAIDEMVNAIDWQPELLHIHDLGVPDGLIQSLRSDLKDCIFLELNTFSLPSSRRGLIDMQMHMTRWCHWKYTTECKIRYQELGHHNIIFPYINDESRFFKEDDMKCLDFRQKLGIPSDAVVLGRIGQKNKSKWSELTLSSFRSLSEVHTNLYLILVGLPDYYQNLLKTSYKSISSRILVLDYVNTDEELRIIYSSIDIFVHTAWLGESFGFVLAESQLCETPVVALSTPYNDNSQIELVRHQVGGMVAQSEADFVCFLRELTASKPKRDALGKQGRSHIIDHYSLSRLSKDLEILVKVLIQHERSEWSQLISSRFEVSSNSYEIVKLYGDRKSSGSDPFVRFMLRYRVTIGRFLLLKFGWNFFLRNYLRLFHIKHL